MRNPTSLAAALLLVALGPSGAAAHSPSVAQVDAASRSAGNRRDVASRIGDVLFQTEWPAEVTQISANELDRHLIVGIRVQGVKFHRPLRREEFVGEVVDLVQRAFTAAPSAEEVDLWASVPIGVGKGVVVSGDLAKPTSRTVFSVSVRRNESAQALRARIDAADEGVFWDSAWAQTAFAGPPT